MTENCPRWIAIDLHLADEIVASLDEWFEHGIHSYPPELGHAEWVNRLQQIRNGFAAFHILSESEWRLADEIPELRKEFETALTLFAEHFEDLWD
jgi:hypothetical protein